MAPRSTPRGHPTVHGLLMCISGQRVRFIMVSRQLEEHWLSPSSKPHTNRDKEMTIRISHSLAGLRRASKRLLARFSIGARCQCNICGQRVQRFLPYRGGWADVPPLMRALGVIGSDVEHHECPACGCHDRERHLLMYLQTTGLLQRVAGSRVLHLAPERHLQEFIHDASPVEYVLGDLYPTSEEIKKINLQAIPYPNDYFDFIIANHVLEHVQDDIQALQEIQRALCPGGFAILQTPYTNGLTNTFEDQSIQTDFARLHAYGQEDHRRLYGKDFVLRVEASGLCQEIGTHAALLPDVNPARMGVNPDEPFLLFQKPVIK